MLKPPIVQVAGVLDLDEASMLAQAGVGYIGFPLRLPVNAEDTSEAEAARIIQELPGGVQSVLITYLGEAGEIAAFCDAMGADIVQLHGDIEPGALRRLRSLRPGLGIIKSLVIGEHDEAALVKLVETLSDSVDAFITDTYDPQSGASGATGKTHDWAISRRLVELSGPPVILAGGLTADNVAEAIREVRPAGVDAHTGLEDSQGRKDPGLVERFVSEALAAFGDLS